MTAEQKEAQRKKALDFIRRIARFTKDGEETADHPEGFDMPSDDAVDTLADIINEARAFLGQR